MRDNALSYVKYEILRYLSDRPRAADTLAGITEWWLHRQRIADGSAMVREALDGLIRDGLVARSRQSSADSIYYLRDSQNVSRPPGIQH